MRAFQCDECRQFTSLRRDEPPLISLDFAGSIKAEFDSWEHAAAWLMKNCGEDEAKRAVRRVFPKMKVQTTAARPAGTGEGEES